MPAARAIVFLLLMGATMIANQNRISGQTQRGSLLRHIVLYKFRDDLPEAEVQEVVAAFQSLPGKIPEIVSLESGVNVSSEGKSEGLTHGFVVTFRSEADLQTYLQHPAHLDYVSVVKNRREKVVVFDYWTEAED